MSEKIKTLGFDKIYVINLKKRHDRRQRMLLNFPELELTFIEAVDANDIDQRQLIEEGSLNTRFQDPAGMVTIGVFACALSHKKAWDQALRDGVTDALILEDDVQSIFKLVEERTFSEYYKGVLDEVSNLDWDLVNLGKKTEYQDGIHVGNYLMIPRFNTNYNGAHSYAITSKMAKELSDNYFPITYAADVYLEQFCKSHNIFTVKKSIFRQDSDKVDGNLSDSDAYYNAYREGGGTVGLTFDEKGHVLDKQVVQYLQHPKDMVDSYPITVLEKPRFGYQKFKKTSQKLNTQFFGIVELIADLRRLAKDYWADLKMVELYSHCGESTFFFASSGLFNQIYAIDPLRGEDLFNLENDITWQDVALGFHSNTYFFEDCVNHVKRDALIVDTLFKDKELHFVYINVRNLRTFEQDLKIVMPKLIKNGILGGSNFDKVKDVLHTRFGAQVPTLYEDGSWSIIT